MSVWRELVAGPLQIIIVRRRFGPLGEEYYRLSKECPDWAGLVAGMKAAAVGRGPWDTHWLTRLEDRLEVTRAVAAEVFGTAYDTDEDIEEAAGVVAALPRFTEPVVVLEVATFYRVVALAIDS